MPRVKKEAPVKKEPTVKVLKPRTVASSAPKKAVSVKSESVGLSVPLYSLAGRESGTLALPKEVFGQKVNKDLLSQAIRVYSANKKTFTASTKTRGEVEGSTAKIFRQKGTGRARHGAVRAPIFVGGGIVFGPKPRKVKLSMPQKMKKAALISALSSKAADKSVFGVSGIEKASGKTKEVVKLIKQIGIKGALVVTEKKLDNVARAGRNIPGVSVLSVSQLNVYEVLNHQSLLVSKEVLEVLGKKEIKQ
ncbi:50S ribosomal protein L4 [Candidatus Daviesbacteria bacterium]|nr:50S ribosomal protein L4 [Candidatus Daviesbacteria bacterium]